jgi:hypothetical protein
MGEVSVADRNDGIHEELLPSTPIILQTLRYLPLLWFMILNNGARNSKNEPYIRVL